MTKDEYLKALKDVELEYNDTKRKLAIKYAFSNNPYSDGDIVEDHYCKIKVDTITWTYDFNSNLSYCVYKGVRLKKDNTPYKSGERESIHQTNIEK